MQCSALPCLPTLPAIRCDTRGSELTDELERLWIGQCLCRTRWPDKKGVVGSFTRFYWSMSRSYAQPGSTWGTTEMPMAWTSPGQSRFLDSAADSREVYNLKETLLKTNHFYSCIRK